MGIYDDLSLKDWPWILRNGWVFITKSRSSSTKNVVYAHGDFNQPTISGIYCHGM